MSGTDDQEPPIDGDVPEGEELDAAEEMGEAIDKGGRLMTADDLKKYAGEVLDLAEARKKRAADQRRQQRDKKKPARNEALEKAFKPFPMDGSAPVRPLGVSGSQYYFLDALNQLVEKSADKLSQNGIDDLFKSEAAQRWALETYGRETQDGKITIDRDLLKRALIAACGDANGGAAFDANTRLRGVGAWRDDDGGLIWHMGDKLMVHDSGAWRERDVGLLGRLIFPAGTPQPRPMAAADLAEMPVEARAGALLALLKSWNWSGGELDARLLLGWMVASMASGALKWRPSCWITGDWGWGKSTIHTIIKAVAGGDDSIVQAADATAAGVWQTLRSRSLPVALDEVEANADNAKKEAIIELARESASGGTKLRGTGEHTGISFAIWSSFLFSSILKPPLKPQDVSRIVSLHLGPLSKDAELPPLNREALSETGRAFRRRIVDMWPRLDAHLSPWWDAVFKATREPRCADVYGTVLAFSWAVLEENPADASDAEAAMRDLGPRLTELLAEAGRDHDELLSHLSTQQLEPWDKGQKYTLRQIVYGAADWPRNAPDVVSLSNDFDARRCNSALVKYQLRVVEPRNGEGAGRQFLAIANKGQSLGRLFFKTRWQGGVWHQSALRVPGAFKAKQRFDGGVEWCVMVPLEAVLGERPKVGDGMP